MQDCPLLGMHWYDCKISVSVRETSTILPPLLNDKPIRKTASRFHNFYWVHWYIYLHELCRPICVYPNLISPKLLLQASSQTGTMHLFFTVTHTPRVDPVHGYLEPSPQHLSAQRFSFCRLIYGKSIWENQFAKVSGFVKPCKTAPPW